MTETLNCENINYIKIFFISWKNLPEDIAWGYKVFQRANGKLNYTVKYQQHWNIPYFLKKKKNLP